MHRADDTFYKVKYYLRWESETLSGLNSFKGTSISDVWF